VSNWSVVSNSMDYQKKTRAPSSSGQGREDGEAVITYRVRYSW